jgi:uncharacterized membrane protein
MVAFDPQSQAQSPKAVIPYQNVHGWERTASIGGGLLLIAKGLRKGGLFGLINLGMGGMGVLRGITGHCEVKRVMARSIAAPGQHEQSLCTDTTPLPQLHMDNLHAAADSDGNGPTDHNTGS